MCSVHQMADCYLVRNRLFADGREPLGVSLLDSAPEPAARRLADSGASMPALSACLLTRTINKLRTKRGRYGRRQKPSILQIEIALAGKDQELKSAFASLAQSHAAALLVTADPFFDTRRDRIIALAAQFRLPAIYQFRDYVVAGGLVSYGVSLADGYRQVGIYAGRVLQR